MSVKQALDGVQNEDRFVLGKTRQWPTPPRDMTDADNYMQLMWAVWRAETMVKTLGGDVGETRVRRKIVGYDMFAGHRPYWCCSLTWQGDYYSATDLNPLTAPQFNMMFAVQTMSLNGDTRIIYSEAVTKLARRGLNTFGWNQQRVVVLTDKHLYKLYANKKYEVCKKVPIPLAQIRSVTVSKKSTEVCVVNTTAGDHVFCFNHSDRACEFAIYLHNTCRELHNTNVDVKVATNDVITFTLIDPKGNPQPQKMLTFEDDPKLMHPKVKFQKNEKFGVKLMQAASV